MGADDTTLSLMSKTANRQELYWLDSESLQNFPCETLGEIDQLWLDASGGKFGFSLQKRIYVEECGGTPNGQYDQAAWHCFIDKVGWPVVKENEWVSSTYLTYDTTAPTGHLPFLHLGGLRERWICSLVYRLENCKMQNPSNGQ